MFHPLVNVHSTAHPLVDVQEQQPHPTPRDGGYPDDTERLSLQWFSDPDPLPPESARVLLTPPSAALSAPSSVGGASVPYRYNQLSHFQSPQMPQHQGGGQQVTQVRFRVPEYQHFCFQNPQSQFKEQVPLLRAFPARCRNFTPLVTRPSSRRLSLLWIKGAGLDRQRSHLSSRSRGGAKIIFTIHFHHIWY